MKEIAQRAVACKHWRWIPGMLSSDTGLRLDEFTLEEDWEAKYPDLTDPATLGCLLHLVREAWGLHHGDDSIPSTRHTSSGWGVGASLVVASGLIVLPTFDTEAEALVAALEAAP